MTRKIVNFKNRAINIAAHLYFPEEFQEKNKYPAIVAVHPGGGVKEQASGLYASSMAAEGYIAIAFDASYQGESEGSERYLEDPSTRVEDIRCAVDYLTTLDYIDTERIGALGICAGGGYVVSAAVIDKRIKAIATISGVNIGLLFATSGTPEQIIQLLGNIGAQRTSEARGWESLMEQWVPEENSKDSEEVDYREAYEYYRTPRAQHPNSVNQYRATSMASIIGFDAFRLIDKLLSQPLQIIVGETVGAFQSYVHGHELYERAASDNKDIFVIKEATHISLYDKPKYVTVAVDKLVKFFDTNL